MASPSPRLYLYAVVPPGQDEPLVISAENWVFGLGLALERTGHDGSLPRLICEVHPNGMVVAEDHLTRDRWVLYRLGEQQAPLTAPASETPVVNGHPNKAELG